VQITQSYRALQDYESLPALFQIRGAVEGGGGVSC